MIDVTITGDNILLILLAFIYGAACTQVGITIGENRKKIIK